MESKQKSSFLDKDIDNLSSENIRNIISHIENENGIFREILSGSSEGIIVASFNGTILFINEKARSFLEADRDLKNLKNISTESPMFREQENKYNSSSIIRHNKRILRVIREPVAANELLLFFITDLTDIYAVRKSISDNINYMNNMLTFLNYEINNPLQRMHNFIRLAEETSSSYLKKQAEVLKRDIREIDKTLSGFSRSVTDNPYLFKRFSPAELIEKSLQLFKYNAEDKDLSISLHIPDNLPSVLGNFNSLQQALSNIIANAVEASDEGDNITIRAEHDESSLYISVSDHGKGISYREIHSIFEPFYSTKEEQRGLGLTISARIIYNHLGTISVSSIMDEGTVVNISIPLRREGQPSLTYEDQVSP